MLIAVTFVTQRCRRCPAGGEVAAAALELDDAAAFAAFAVFAVVNTFLGISSSVLSESLSWNGDGGTFLILCDDR